MRSINDERQNHPDLVYFWVAHEDFIDESSESLPAIRANASEGGKTTNFDSSRRFLQYARRNYSVVTGTSALSLHP